VAEEAALTAGRTGGAGLGNAAMMNNVKANAATCLGTVAIAPPLLDAITGLNGRSRPART
jgi:hypothetical protein